MTKLELLGRAVKRVVSGGYHMTALKLDDLIAKLPFTNTKSWEGRFIYHFVRLCQDCYVIALILDDEKLIAETGEYLSKSMVIWRKTVL